MLANVADDIAAFVDSDFDAHLLWEPAADYEGVSAWDDVTVRRLKEMRFAQLEKGNAPDMLLYAMGRLETFSPSFADVLDDFSRGEEHM